MECLFLCLGQGPNYTDHNPFLNMFHFGLFVSVTQNTL